MLDRYSRPVMRKIWSTEHRLQKWLDVEMAMLDARADRGDFPKYVVDIMRNAVVINVKRMNEIEAETRHDVLAFVQMVQESLQAHEAGEWSHELHRFLTSYDVVDPALILLLREACDELFDEADLLWKAITAKATEHKCTYYIARTHGQYAEPSTFGCLLRSFAEELNRNIARLADAYDNGLADGKMSGAVGSYEHIDPELEKAALLYLGLEPAQAETQILQRDRHAAVLQAIALMGAGIERMARTFWEMMRSDVGELREPRGKKQKGSSAMSHKRNPIMTEQLMGLPRLLRAYATTAVENIATPECRDISQSSVERHILPDATSLIHYMLIKARELVEGLEVFPTQMRFHLEEGSGRVWASQGIRDALLAKGVPYETAYGYMQQITFAAADRHEDLYDCITGSALVPEEYGPIQLDVVSILGSEVLLSFFEYEKSLERGIARIFRE